MRDVTIEKNLVEDVFLYLAKYELFKPQLYLAALVEKLGYTSKMVEALMSQIGLDEPKLGKEAELIRSQLEAKKMNFISILDEAYPSLLRQIVQPPLILFYRGNLEVLGRKTLSVVGTRRPSFDGIRACDGVIGNLAKFFRDISIVSGLALGVDSLVHRASLKYGLGAISVLPSSVDAPTPTSNFRLAEQILESGGLLLSEKLPGHHIQSYSYLERNRIISGLSTKTVIIEAAIKSGSIATAKLALEQNRDVYAMPGSLSNPVAEGCNYLISLGAYPLYRLDALLDDEEFSVPKRRRSSKRGGSALPSNYAEDELLTLIRKKKKLDMETINAKVKLDEAEILSKLVEYELEGLIMRDGDYVRSL